MRLNESKLRLLEVISKKSSITSKDIDFLNSSMISTYLNELMNNGFLEKNKKKFIISKNRFARFLSNLLNEDSSMINVLKNEGIPILMILANPENNDITSISQTLGLSESSIYPYLRRFIKRQIIYKNNTGLIINKELWNELFQFIQLYRSYYVQNQFNKLPSNAKIYFESPYEVLFSLLSEFREASKTAFSIYDEYGIKLFEREIFYRIDELPKRRLNPQTILLDSLRIAGSEKEESIRRRIYCFLFYRKNLSRLKKVKHPDLDILKNIAQSKGKIKETMFPTYEELLTKGDDYDIKI